MSKITNPRPSSNSHQPQPNYFNVQRGIGLSYFWQNIEAAKAIPELANVLGGERTSFC